MNNIYCVVVTFNPDIDEFLKFVAIISKQVKKLIIVDNNSENKKHLECKLKKEPEIFFISNNENYGIAKAQNQGIDIATAENATHVIFFDQDSQISKNFIKILIDEEKKILENGIKLAAIGPQIIDETSGNSIPFINYKNGFKKRIFLNSKKQNSECFSLLSSGTLINMTALKDIGNYKEDLFIEYVDVEWGARAKSKGYSLYGTSKTKIIHNLGETRINIFSITIPLHSPIRHYYTMRNGVYMQKQSYIPLYWKINDIARLIRSFIIFSTLTPPRTLQIKMMIKGIIDGFSGRMGKF